MPNPLINIGSAANSGDGEVGPRAWLQKINQLPISDSTINAGSGDYIGTTEAKITAAIAAAVLAGKKYVWVPQSMLPYNASLVTFNTSVKMLREGGNPSVYDVQAYGAATITTGADSTSAFIAAAAGCTAQLTVGGGVFYMPAGKYKLTASVTITTNTMVAGAGRDQTEVQAWATDAFVTPAGVSSSITFRDFSLLEASAIGALDTKAKKGITINGTTGNQCPNISFEHLFVRGWLHGMYCAYMTQSSFIDVITQTCTNAITSFGQGINVGVTNCQLTVTGGNASLNFLKDGAIQPEGWMITTTQCFGGAYGILSDGFLALRVANCVIDLVTNIGVSITNAPSSSFVGNWIYATNGGIRFEDLGVSVDQHSSVVGNYIEVTAANGKNVYVGTNNNNISVIGNALRGDGSGGTERLVFVNGTNTVIIGNALTGASANPSLFINGAGCTIHGNTGANTVQYNLASQAILQPTEAVLVSGVTVSTTVEYNTVIEVTLTAARLVGNTINQRIGQRIVFTLIQDGTGGRAVTWNAAYKVSWSDTGNTLNRRSSIAFIYDGTNWNQDGAQTPYV